MKKTELEIRRDDTGTTNQMFKSLYCRVSLLWSLAYTFTNKNTVKILRKVYFPPRILFLGKLPSQCEWNDDIFKQARYQKMYLLNTPSQKTSRTNVCARFHVHWLHNKQIHKYNLTNHYSKYLVINHHPSHGLNYVIHF